MPAPVTKLSLAFAVGVAWALVGAPLAFAPLAALLLLIAPGSPYGGPDRRFWWALAGLAGLSSGLAVDRATERCGVAALDEPVALEGRFLASPRSGSAPFVSTGGCGPYTVVVGDGAVAAGERVRIEGVWHPGRFRPWLGARSVAPVEDHRRPWRWRAVAWRDRIAGRLDRLYGDRAPLASALTLARREGLDPGLRDAFARAGIAHLLAISGFHVGVVGGVLLAVLVALGVASRKAAVVAAVLSWGYVAFIGFPDAACRAALIMTSVAISRGRGQPSARWAAIGAALLILLALDPGRLAAPGFQLSFAGAAGLTAWSGRLTRAIRSRVGRGVPVGVVMALSAGMAATVATLPVAAWHFERISVVGIPVTLVAAPLVTLSLIGCLGSIALDFVTPGLASVLAGGVTTVLVALEWFANTVGSMSWASVWTTRGTVFGGMVGVGLAWCASRAPRVGLRTRRGLTGIYVAAGITAWPLLVSLQGRGSTEILMIDVGQGDAIALRSPGGRWVLVDAGPPPREGSGPAGHPAVRALKSRGVERLEALILTHPDLDHIGGATAVLEVFDVGVVYDPARPAGRQAYVDLLASAAERSVPWRPAQAGDRVELDGLLLRVLHPAVGLPQDAESNATSVVLLATMGSFDALLTGDAYKDVERLVAPELMEVVEVLKVGHHGSDTSTDPVLLEAARPEVALLSVGRSNRYGHPSPEVLRRLEERGIPVRRTDREGDIRVVARRDGSYSVTSRR